MVTPMRKLLLALFLLAASPALATSAFTTPTDWNDLTSWLSAATGNGPNTTYLDASGNGNNFSVPGGTAPVFTGNAYQGLSAYTFNGSTTSPIVASNGQLGSSAFNWTPCIADCTLILVADVNPSVTGTSSYVAFGTAYPVTNGWGFYYHSGKMAFASSGCQGLNYTWSGQSVSTGVPHVFAFAWSANDNIVGFALDGGAFVTTSISASNANFPEETTFYVGATGATEVCNWSSTVPWYGNVYAVMVFRENLQNANKATRWAAVQAFLRSRYKTP